MPAMSLPQPPDTRNRYHYVPYDTFETDWLGDPQRLGSLMRYEVASINESTVKRYSPGTLVWVLLSKGKPKQTNNNNQGIDTLALHKKRRDKKNKRKNISESASSSVPVDNIASESSKDEKSQNSSSREPKSDLTCEMINNHSRKEFFLRARVISDDEETSESERDGKTPTAKHGERRILVRYSRGATYRVRAYNLIPVLEPSLHNNNWQSSVENDQTQSQTSSSSIALPPLVVVVPETNIYRRVAKVHTTPDDSFMEIGCDYGITVDKIHKSLEEAGDVPKVWPVGDAGSKSVDTTIINEDKSENGDNDRVSCLGVDRSTESIDIANERYPKCKFALGNVLVPDEMTSIRTLCEQSLKGSGPSIVCIDINGNREIEGVLECVKVVMNERWKRQPRMIIVKSRFLYWELKKDGGW